MKLSAVPFEKLKVGDEVISARGTLGVIGELIEEGTRKEQEIVVMWDNGNYSKIRHCLCDHVVCVNSNE